ncbi:glycerol channel [Exophiala oligosperma]
MSKLEQDKDTFIPAPPPIHTQESSSSHSDQATFTHREHENNNQRQQQQRHILQQPQHRQRNPMDPNPNPYPYHAEHGPPIDNALKYAEAEEDYQHHKTLWWSRVRHHLRDPFAEFLGTFIMILFGDGSVAQVTLSANPNLPKSSQNKGDYQSISWGWGIGVMLGVYVAGCAGGHLNPAITMVNCIYRGFPWWKFPIYACAQVAGCFCGAAVIYGNYKSAIDAYEGGASIRTVPGYSDTATAGVFCTYPQPFLTKTGQFFSEIVSSTVLVFVIFAVKDDANLGAGNLVPLALFFLIFGIGATLGWETGYAINLARDFGPRLFTYFVGYGHEVWSAGGYYFWIPMIAPFIGCTFGGFLYDAFIYTGESPINTPWMGLKRLVHPSKKGIKEAFYGRPEKEV